MSKRNLLVVAVLTIILFPAASPAQTQTGTVSGVVVDPTEAVIPGATVILNGISNGVKREVLTNDKGFFVFDKVWPGTYSLVVSKEAFRETRVEKFDVVVGQSADLGALKMQLGTKSQTVQVEAAAGTLVETQTPQITGTFTAKQVQVLRQGFGGLDNIAILTPGVVPGFGNINSNGMQVSANGQRSRSTQFMLDGHQMNDITIGGPSFFINNYDMIAEYQVVTNQFSAEYGRNLGATVNILTKSGTNDFHGAVAWLHQNSALDSKTSFQSRFNLAKPRVIDNQWSITAGGPIRRNRLFYYFAYRGDRQPGSALDIGTVGSNLTITSNGINTLVAALPGSKTLQLYKTAGPFGIPEGSPSCVPGTTSLRSVVGVPSVEVCAPQRKRPTNTKFYEYSGRMDLIGSKHNIFGRYMIQNNDFCCSGGVDGYWISIPNNNRNTGLTYTYSFSPRMINYIRFDYSRFLVAFEGGNTKPISDVSSNLANISLASPWQSFGLATNLPQNRLLNSFQWQENWSLSYGQHFLKAGIEYQYNRTSLFFLPFINGSFSFVSSDLADFANNTPSTVSFAAGKPTFDPAEVDQFYYFQDDIRLKPNFTLNLGVRYENNGQPINKAVNEVLQRERDPQQAFWLQSVPISERTIPRIPGDRDNFAPRVGFAYTPRFAHWLFGDQKSVIRGGYGIAYELAFYNILLNVTTAAPRVFLFSLTGANAIPIPGTGIGSDVAAAIPVPRNTIDPRSLAQTTMARDFHNPYGQNWSFGIERQTRRNQVFEIRYVGTNGIGLFQSINRNPRFTRLASPSTLSGLTMPAYTQFILPNGLVPCADPKANGFGRLDCTRAAVRERLNAARSNYNSLQTRYEVRNLKDQLTASASYTWAKGIDNVSEVFTFFGGGSVAFSQNPFDIIKGERGPSNQVLAQTLALSYIWEVPLMRSQRGIFGHILGGWQLSGITTFLSGRPYSPAQRTGNRYCQEDSGFNATFIGFLATCRPFLSNPNAPVPTVGFVDSTGAIHLGSLAGPLTTADQVHFLFNNDFAVRFFGNSPFGIGRNNFLGDMTNNWDMALDKRTKLTERFALRYRMAMIDAFNHRNFGVPTARVDLGDFGIPSRNNVGGRSIRMGMWIEY